MSVIARKFNFLISPILRFLEYQAFISGYWSSYFMLILRIHFMHLGIILLHSSTDTAIRNDLPKKMQSQKSSSRSGRREVVLGRQFYN